MLTALLKPRCAAFALAATLSAGLFSTVAAAGLKAGDTLPDLASFKLEGKLPDALKGKVILLDFWASWCDPCKASFPVLEDLHKRQGPKGLVVIAVNVDENRADMDDFLKKHAATFTMLRDVKQKLVETAGIATMAGALDAHHDDVAKGVKGVLKGDRSTPKAEKHEPPKDVARR